MNTFKNLQDEPIRRDLREKISNFVIILRDASPNEALNFHWPRPHFHRRFTAKTHKYSADRESERERALAKTPLRATEPSIINANRFLFFFRNEICLSKINQSANWSQTNAMTLYREQQVKLFTSWMINEPSIWLIFSSNSFTWCFFHSYELIINLYQPENKYNYLII